MAKHLNLYPPMNRQSNKQLFLLLVLCIGCFSAATTWAQLPRTKIYLFDFQKTIKGVSLNNPVTIAPGKLYNNQPYFTPDNRLMYFVSSDDTNNTEIYQYDLAKQKTKRVTRTPECEYSPKLTTDMEHISCVRVERDKKTQRLYTYSLRGKKPYAVFPEQTTIGYYEWLSLHEYLAFELPEPFSLVQCNTLKKTRWRLDDSIGRTFYARKYKGRSVYVDKEDSLQWVLRSLLPENLRAVKNRMNVPNPVVCETLPGEEDYCILADGSILMGHEGKLYLRKSPWDFPKEAWTQVADLNAFGINSFYRIAVSPSYRKLAVVVYEGKKP